MRTLVRAHPGTSRYIEIAFFPIHLSENATKHIRYTFGADPVPVLSLLLRYTFGADPVPVLSLLLRYTFVAEPVPVLSLHPDTHTHLRYTFVADPVLVLRLPVT